MPVPNPAAIEVVSTNRLALQSMVFACYLMVAIALLFSAWRIAATSEMIDRVMIQQSAILERQAATLAEIKEARTSIPAQVQAQAKDVAKDVAKEVTQDVMKNVANDLFTPKIKPR
jgi:hypothetical protein